MRKPKIDYLLLISVLALSAVGLIMVFSASPTMALKLGDSYYYIKRQIFYLLLGFTALYYGTRLSIPELRKRANLIFLVSVLLLLLVYLPVVGKRLSGAARWIDLVFFTFQPSEIIKLTMVLFLAGTLSKIGDGLKKIWSGLVPILALIGVVTGLIILQPDLGTAITIGVTSFIMLFTAGAAARHLSLLAGLGISSIVVLSLTSAYRLRRLVAYVDPWKDPQGTGFHIIQSLYAVGSGGLTGLGLGASRQKFFYLPQQFTDFIFAILCEELGLLGGVSVVILFMIFAARGLRIALQQSDGFTYLLATGLVSWLTLQALINIMVVLGLLPTTGIPLPFISFGGTATMVNLFAVGILLNLSKGSPQ